MREIKFRAFIKHIGWVVPVEQINFDVKTVEVDLSSGQGDTSEYDFDEIELMQYTGLKDINGIEIYEGDIVCVRIFSDIKQDKVIASENAVVKFKDDSFGLQLGNAPHFATLGGFYNTTFEVVGNIFENKELLEGEKQ